ncbi:MAG TPA: hypothetical protein PLL75_00765 [Candidatus Omnitrophota bacterium]|nr:hypothetical protein [Candidatus Omnitrophota bacterium]HPS36245.1 hypothetical protein [Candidatus Omnitrophota bacterium]
MVKQELLDVLCCPETKQGLSVADAALVAKINERIAKKELKDRGGKTVTQTIDSGLVRADKKFLYAVRNDIPVMLIDESIPLVCDH